MTERDAVDILSRAGNPNSFRSAIRAWLNGALPPTWPEQATDGSEDAYVELQRWWFSECRKAGLVLPGIDKRFGGGGLSVECQMIIVEEFARAGAPPLQTAMFTVSLTHVPTTLLAWGTPEQQRNYLPGVLAGDVWCQGFSEPGAGSDLASLRTRAVRQGSCYVVNGQKIWSSYSRYAKYCLLLVRTDVDAPKHNGISYLILDMKSPGVEVRPIRQVTGHSEFGEIFLTDVRVPIDNLIGPENKGWAVAQSTLAAERGVLAFERAERQRRNVEEYLRGALASRAAWTHSSKSRGEFVSLIGDMQAVRRLIRRLLLTDPHQSGSAMLPAMIKLLSTTLVQRYADLQVRLEGLPGQLCGASHMIDGHVPMHDYLQSFGDTIAAGSNEIMRSLIAERKLGLPRDRR